MNSNVLEVRVDGMNGLRWGIVKLDSLSCRYGFLSSSLFLCIVFVDLSMMGNVSAAV